MFPLIIMAPYAYAEEHQWHPPALIVGNPILEAMRKHPLTRGQIVVSPYAPDGYDKILEFIEEVGIADTAGIVDHTSLTDGVGIAYKPPLTVYFSAAKDDRLVEQADGELMRRQVFHASSGSVDYALLKKPIAPGSSVMASYVVFAVDADDGHFPAVCYARQVITILYTGTDGSSFDLRACAETES